MTANKQTLKISSDILSTERLDEIEKEGYYALDAWNAKTVSECLFSLNTDPWDYLGDLRRGLVNTKLRVTLAGQALMGCRHFSDETVEAFIAVLADKGTDIVRVYDPLNDPRNLETAMRAIKKYGMTAQAAMVFAEIPVYSPSFFAGYAAQLASMGADSVAVCGLDDPYITRELVCAVKKAISLPLAVTGMTEEICVIALDAGADFAELCDKIEFSSQIGDELEAIRAEAGFVPLAEPITNVLYTQAVTNLGGRYTEISPDFKALVLGKYGRTPAPIDGDFSKKICGDEHAILVRPADLLEGEYDAAREKLAPYYEDGEDILTYLIFGVNTLSFFEYRKAKRYHLDLPHADPIRGIHTI
ncbi:MAG: hypothetical protein ACI3XI_01110 [Eubacteriales bacterium]